MDHRSNSHYIATVRRQASHAVTHPAPSPVMGLSLTVIRDSCLRFRLAVSRKKIPPLSYMRAASKSGFGNSWYFPCAGSWYSWMSQVSSSVPGYQMDGEALVFFFFFFFFFCGGKKGNASCTVTLVRRVWDSSTACRWVLPPVGQSAV